MRGRNDWGQLSPGTNYLPLAEGGSRDGPPNEDETPGSVSFPNLYAKLACLTMAGRDRPKMPCRECYRNSPLQRPLTMQNLEGPVLPIIRSARCIKVSDFHCPAGECSRKRKYFGRRKLGPASPQLTLRSQRRFPDCQLANSLSVILVHLALLQDIFPAHGPFHRYHIQLPAPLQSLDTLAKPCYHKCGPPHKLP